MSFVDVLLFSIFVMSGIKINMHIIRNHSFPPLVVLGAFGDSKFVCGLDLTVVVLWELPVVSAPLLQDEVACFDMALQQVLLVRALVVLVIDPLQLSSLQHRLL